MSQPALERLRAAHALGRVVGLKDVAGIKPRLDIDVLMRDDPDCFNLYVLAFAELKKNTKEMGYFEIAGIHGLPKRLWGDVQVKGKDLEPREEIGYCAHAMTTFPTWHRAYLAMLEQSLFLQMHNLANLWSKSEDKERYTAAAQRFRLPYWDYWRPRGGRVVFGGVFTGGRTEFDYDYKCPLIFTSDKIKVRAYPDDELILLHEDNKEFGKNPFFEYKFEPGQVNDSEWNTLNMDTIGFPREKTVRYPIHKEDPSSVNTLNKVLNSLRMDLNRLALTMLSDPSYANYRGFSTNADEHSAPPETEPSHLDQVSGASGSLEAIHDIYHGLIGGQASLAGGAGGHMSRVAVAAFDPIFWFHHGQIERMFSIWQAIHHGEHPSWFTEPKKNDPPGLQKKAEDPLVPFRLDGTKFWSSENLRSTDLLGYTYPEINPTDKVATREKVREMYKWSVTLENSEDTEPIPDDMRPITVEDLVFFKGVVNVKEESKSPKLKPARPISHQNRVAQTTLPAVGDYSFEWYIDDRVQRLAFNGAFTIYYFISDRTDGSAPSSSENLMLQGCLAGVNHIFAAPVEACDNCGRQDEQAHVVRNTVAVTSLLLDYVALGQLESMRPEHVKPFLIERLKWKVLTINGVVIDPRNMTKHKDFEINVSCKKARLPRDSGDVTYENYPEIISAIVGRGSPTQDSR